jgi:hypothetical protein
MLDHDWFIGRSDQEPWALVSEPYAPPATPDKIEALRRELAAIGASVRVWMNYGRPGKSNYPQSMIVCN